MSDHSKPRIPGVKRIPVSELRQLFSHYNYWERTTKGEFHKVVISRHTPDSKSEPLGTESQLISIRDKEQFEVARVHAYVRPDGSLGASGQADPKMVYDEVGNVIYLQERKKK
jgi:hypothetical protein